MYLTTIAGGSGDTYQDVQGRTLILTGNDRLWSGRQVWTDGHYIFSFCQQSDVPPNKPVISEDKLLPILCNNGSELLVFDKNFALIGKYSCSKTNITAFSNIADYFAMGDNNGNIYTSDGKEYNISKSGYSHSDCYMANSIATQTDGIYALTSTDSSLDSIGEDFSLIHDGKLMYTGIYLQQKLRNKMGLPENKTLEHSGYYFIPGEIENVGWPKDVEAKILSIRTHPKDNAFNSQDEDDALEHFLDYHSFMSGLISLNSDGELIGWYNFDTKEFDIGSDIDAMLGKYNSTYEEYMTAITGGAADALIKLGNKHCYYSTKKFVAFFYKLWYLHHKEQNYDCGMSARYLYNNGNVLITATGSGDCTTIDSYATGDDINNLKYSNTTTKENEINKQYQGIIDKSGNISLTETESEVYKLDDTVLVSSGTGFCENKQVTTDKAGLEYWVNFSAIHRGQNVFGFYGGESGQNIYVNGKAIEKLSSRQYVNNRLNWMSKGTLAKLCKFLGAEAEK